MIPRQELAALALADPQTRSARVRVVQGLAGSADPPPAPYADGTVGVHVVVVQPVDHHHGHAIPGKQSAKVAKEDAKAFFIIAAAVAVGAALTEGLRYDGWVELHPDHPVHLYGWDGRYAWVPLSQLTPENAAWARKAVVRPSEGPWHTLGRAPLNRQGFTYSVFMGSSQTPMLGGEVRGFAGHVQLGRFVSQELGVLLDIGMGWGDDGSGRMFYDSRHALELQYLPLAANIFHAGLFGQMGVGYRLDDITGVDRTALLLGGGAIAQLELTTRLAITARAAQTLVYGTRTTDFTVGLSIY